ncbi:DUF11 domain-containing protein [Patescibacteria group bacterium]|nr:DUF11 domain-containing protein [Patescibacteria group bacterium]
MKKIIILYLLVFLVALISRPIFASVSCTTQYGGGQTCVSTGELLVNKKVFDPVSQTFVDNLGRTDHVFAIGEEVTFSIEVKNVGDAPVNDITVTDTLPNFLTWTGGDPLVSTISSLGAGESVTKTIRTKVVSTFGSGVVCANNLASVEATITSTSTATAPVSDPQTDTAQLCVNLPTAAPTVVTPTPTPPVTPPTGPSDWLLLLSSPAWLGGIGFYLKKLGSKKGGENK